MEHEATSFVLQLFATLIGAGVGIGLVIWWDRRKKSTEKEETRKIVVESILEEINENHEGLKQFKMPVWNNTDGKFKGVFGLASDPAFQSTVSGGNFLLLPKQLQKDIRVIYHNFSLYNTFMTDIIGFSSHHLSGADASTQANELIRRLQERVNDLMPLLSDIIPKLKSEI